MRHYYSTWSLYRGATFGNLLPSLALHAVIVIHEILVGPYNIMYMIFVMSSDVSHSRCSNQSCVVIFHSFPKFLP
jgi:hypothetical protein